MKNMPKRILTYLAGYLIIAIGINISKMSGLGISPVSSIPRALEVVFGLSLGTMVIIVYCVLVFVQFLILRKDFKLINLLGVPCAIVFGWMVDFVGINPDAIGHLLYYCPKPDDFTSLAPFALYLIRFAYLIVSIIIIAIGVYIYLSPGLVPMPSEGVAAAIAKISGKPFGDCKTIVDVSLISIALIIQLIFLGGLKSFTGNTVVVREGTILSALLVGQCVKFISKKLKK